MLKLPYDFISLIINYIQLPARSYIMENEIESFTLKKLNYVLLGPRASELSCCKTQEVQLSQRDRATQYVS